MSNHRAQPPSESEPVVVELLDQPYAAIRAHVTMETIHEVAGRIPEVLRHLEERGIPARGAPFLKYDVIGPGEELEVEAGVPVEHVAESAGVVDFSIIRAGRFATVNHHGHPSGLREAAAVLLDWAARAGERWDRDKVDGAEHWGARLEVYNTDPATDPDPNTWDTDLLFRLA